MEKKAMLSQPMGGLTEQEIITTRSQFKRMAVQLGYEKVVHCKDCKRYSESEPHYRIYGDGNCRTWNSYVSEKGFCYYGERKTDEKV